MLCISHINKRDTFSNIGGFIFAKSIIVDRYQYELRLRVTLFDQIFRRFMMHTTLIHTISHQYSVSTQYYDVRSSRSVYS